MSETTECPVKIFGKPEVFRFENGDCDSCDGILTRKFTVQTNKNDIEDGLGTIYFGRDGCGIEIYSEKKTIY